MRCIFRDRSGFCPGHCQQMAHGTQMCFFGLDDFKEFQLVVNIVKMRNLQETCISGCFFFNVEVLAVLSSTHHIA